MIPAVSEPSALHSMKLPATVDFAMHSPDAIVLSLRSFVRLILLFGCGFVIPVHPNMAQDSEAPSPSIDLPDSDDGLPGGGPIRRYPWFKSLWSQRRGQWAKRSEQDRGALVFLGDSITQGWGDQFKNAFPGAKLANRGISGDTTRGMLLRLKQDVLGLHPKGVVLLMGTNDLEEKAEPETVTKNVRLILQQLKDHRPTMPIVLCTVFPSSESKQRPAAKIKELNQLYLQAVKGDPQVTVIDTWTLFANTQGDAKPEEFPDLLHPNDTGYAKWRDSLIPVLEFLELIPAAPSIAPANADGFVPLFNGQDLTGWGWRPTSQQDRAARERWLKSDPNAVSWPVIDQPMDLDGRKASPDDRYVARHGRLVVATPAEGRRIQQLWTTREFDRDFDFELEFRATPNADSGIFLRGKQLQCRDYLLAGPYKELKSYRPQDWNKISIQVRGNKARCTCNGEILEEAFELPASGPLGLEGDRGQVEYRHLRVREMP
jgi:lysophospholipase L1-like esterase